MFSLVQSSLISSLAISVRWRKLHDATVTSAQGTLSKVQRPLMIAFTGTNFSTPLPPLNRKIFTHWRSPWIIPRRWRRRNPWRNQKVIKMWTMKFVRREICWKVIGGGCLLMRVWLWRTVRWLRMKSGTCRAIYEKLMEIVERNAGGDGGIEEMGEGEKGEVLGPRPEGLQAA